MYPCPRSPPCTSDRRSTPGDTCVHRPPGTTNEPADHRRKQKWCVDRLRRCSAVLSSAERVVLSYFVPSSRSEQWHSGNTCFTPSLSGIGYDVTVLCRSEPMLWLLTLWNQLTLHHSLSLSPKLLTDYWQISLSPNVWSHFICVLTSLSHARWDNVSVFSVHIPEHTSNAVAQCKRFSYVIWWNSILHTNSGQLLM